MAKSEGGGGRSQGRHTEIRAMYAGMGASSRELNRLDRLRAEAERYRDWRPHTGEKYLYELAQERYVKAVAEITARRG